jgi:hypothetical protein
MDCDKVLADAGSSVEAVRALTRKMGALSIAYEFNNQFINGDPASKQFKGLKLRVTDMYNAGYTTQYIDCGSAAAAGRGVLYDSTERQYFLDRVNQICHAIKRGQEKPSALFMNDKMLQCFESAFRREGLLATNRDMFDREITTFRGIPLIDIGLCSDQSTEIITNAETLSGGTDETSIYAAWFAENEGLWGIQQKPLEIRDLGELQTAPKYRDRADWVHGLAHSDPRCIARGYGFVADGGAS